MLILQVISENLPSKAPRIMLNATNAPQLFCYIDFYRKIRLLLLNFNANN